jgi:plastocyanin
MRNVLIASVIALLVSTGVARADEFALNIKDHRFTPAELQVPAGKEFTLTVTNEDATAEEFESEDFNAEKVIAGHQSVVIRMEPLDAGRYEFFGEYHEDTAKGALVAK